MSGGSCLPTRTVSKPRQLAGFLHSGTRCWDANVAQKSGAGGDGAAKVAGIGLGFAPKACAGLPGAAQSNAELRSMTSADRVSRRSFLISVAAGGGGLVLGFELPGGLETARAADRAPEINAWILIRPDDT